MPCSDALKSTNQTRALHLVMSTTEPGQSGGKRRAPVNPASSAAAQCRALHCTELRSALAQIPKEGRRARPNHPHLRRPHPHSFSWQPHGRMDPATIEVPRRLHARPQQGCAVTRHPAARSRCPARRVAPRGSSGCRRRRCAPPQQGTGAAASAAAPGPGPAGCHALSPNASSFVRAANADVAKPWVVTCASTRDLKRLSAEMHHHCSTGTTARTQPGQGAGSLHAVRPLLRARRWQPWRSRLAGSMHQATHAQALELDWGQGGGTRIQYAQATSRVSSHAQALQQLW